MTERTTYHVEDGHTLLYRQPGSPNDQYGILAGKLTLGGRDWKDGVCYPDQAALRPATRKDFEHFRVCSKGYDLT